MRTFATFYVRQLLRINPDGMDVGTIANTLDREPSNIRRLLEAQTAREYAESMCKYCEAQIKRLTAYLHKATEEQS